MGENVGQFLGDYVLQICIALVVLIATAAWVIIRRRRYVKLVEFKRGIEALRLEFRRSIDEARAATARKATAVGDRLLSVIKPIDTSVTDLNVRLGRLEERADSVEAFMAGPQTNALQENEHIAARLRTLEQKLNALTDQVLLIEQTLDRTSRRDQARNNAIEVRLTTTEKQMGDLFPRLELGEKARADLGGVIGLFVKQLKRVNITSAEIAVRVAELESRTKISGLEERLSSTSDPESHRSAENFANDRSDIGVDPPVQGDEAAGIETQNGSAEGKPALSEESPNQPSIDVSRLSENSSAIEVNGHA